MEREKQPDEDAERRHQQAESEQQEHIDRHAPRPAQRYQQLDDAHAAIAANAQRDQSVGERENQTIEARDRFHQQAHRDQHAALGPDIEPHRPRQIDPATAEAAAARRIAFEQDEAHRAEQRENIKPAEEKYRDAMRKLEAPDPALERREKEIARLHLDQSDKREQLDQLQSKEIQRLEDPTKLEFLSEVQSDERLCLDREHAAEREAAKFQRDAVAACDHDQPAYAAAIAAAQTAIAQQQEWEASRQSLREEAVSWRDNSDKNFEITERQQRHAHIMEGRPLDSESSERIASRERNSLQRSDGERSR